MPLGLSGNGLITGFDTTASGFGKVLQVVRATDTTNRTTTSTSFVDVTGMSVTITPQKSTSAIIVMCSFFAYSSGTTGAAEYAITDSSNNTISGAQLGQLGAGAGSSYLTMIAYSTPATTSATTYKMRFKVNGSGANEVFNGLNTGQIYAIEVAA